MKETELDSLKGKYLTDKITAPIIIPEPISPHIQRNKCRIISEDLLIFKVALLSNSKATYSSIKKNKSYDIQLWLPAFLRAKK